MTFTVYHWFKKTLLCFWNKLITELITKMGVAHVFEPGPYITLLLVLVKHCSMHFFCWNQLIEQDKLFFSRHPLAFDSCFCIQMIPSLKLAGISFLRMNAYPLSNTHLGNTFFPNVPWNRQFFFFCRLSLRPLTVVFALQGREL